MTSDGIPLDVLDSAQAKGVDTIEQPIQAQQSQSVLSESEPKGSTPKQSTQQPESGFIKATSAANKLVGTTTSLVFVFVALWACLNNQ